MSSSPEAPNGSRRVISSSTPQQRTNRVARPDDASPGRRPRSDAAEEPAADEGTDENGDEAEDDARPDRRGERQVAALPPRPPLHMQQQEGCDDDRDEDDDHGRRLYRPMNRLTDGATAPRTRTTA